jgi:hypothetical protein
MTTSFLQLVSIAHVCCFGTCTSSGGSAFEDDNQARYVGRLDSLTGRSAAVIRSMYEVVTRDRVPVGDPADRVGT